MVLLTNNQIEKNTEDQNYLLGKFEPSQNRNFVMAKPPYAAEDTYVRKETLEAFKKLSDEAQKEGVKLKIVSGTRNFERQRQIWEAKWLGKKPNNGELLTGEKYNDPIVKAKRILEWSSMPGTSRHHWGTDVDLNNLNNAYWEKGEGLKAYNWLKNNASKFGFCQVYCEKNHSRPNGYNEEKWHWSYLPISKNLTENYKKTISYKQINGFLGAEIAEKLHVIEHYVLGLNPECMR